MTFVHDMQTKIYLLWPQIKNLSAGFINLLFNVFKCNDQIKFIYFFNVVIFSYIIANK